MRQSHSAGVSLPVEQHVRIGKQIGGVRHERTIPVPDERERLVRGPA
jgi:hypothetical protein